MGNLKNLGDLFHHQLKDIYSAEKLRETLDKEATADTKLSELAIESVNPRAKEL